MLHVVKIWYKVGVGKHMELKLPAFDADGLTSFLVCGFLTSRKADVLSLTPVQSKIKIAKVDGTSEAMFVRLIIGGVSNNNKPSGHIHLDFVKESRFRKAPRAASNLEEISQELSVFASYQILSRIESRFRLPWASLPEDGIIKSTRTSVKSKGIQIEQEAGKLSLTGSPLSGIDWSRDRSDSRLVTVNIDSVSKLKVGRAFVEEAYKNSIDVWNKLILSSGTSSGAAQL